MTESPEPTHPGRIVGSVDCVGGGLPTDTETPAAAVRIRWECRCSSLYAQLRDVKGRAQTGKTMEAQPALHDDAPKKRWAKAKAEASGRAARQSWGHTPSTP